ncbi:MAG: alpha/beta fold hydrolase [Halioglobus sp.]
MDKTITVRDTCVHIEGQGPNTLVMLHGWPDTRELWLEQIAHFKSSHTCVSFTLPGFSATDRTDYSVDDIVARIAEIVDAVSPEQRVTLLLHDWGCVFGYEYAMRNSQRVEKMIGLDVGDIDSDALRESLSTAGKLMVFVYQIILAMSFVLPRLIGNPIARLMARALKAGSIKEHIHAGMSMPYAMRWFGTNGGLSGLLPVAPKCPFFYGYATQKPMMFHSRQWLAHLRENPCNRIEPFDCGHWIPVELANELNESLGEWLRSDRHEDVVTK